MAPLALCSVVALAVVVERAIAIRRARRRIAEGREAFLDALDEGGTARAWRWVAKDESLFAQSVKPALQDRAGDAEAPRRALGKRLGMLSMIVQLAPLIGFLGTVTGMIAAFQKIQEMAATGGQAGPGDLAGGIWEALITTAAGLFVAIPAYVAHAGLTGAVNKTLDRLEAACAECAEAFRRRHRERKTRNVQPVAGAGVGGT